MPPGDDHARVAAHAVDVRRLPPARHDQRLAVEHEAVAETVDRRADVRAARPSGSAGVDDHVGRGDRAGADTIPEQPEPDRRRLLAREAREGAGAQLDEERRHRQDEEHRGSGGEEDDGPPHDRARKPRPEPALGTRGATADP